MPRSVTVIDETGKSIVIPKSYSFQLMRCNCGDPCGNVNIVLEDENGKPFAAAQFGWRQILEGFVPLAMEAREQVEGPMMKQ